MLTFGKAERWATNMIAQKVFKTLLICVTQIQMMDNSIDHQLIKNEYPMNECMTKKCTNKYVVEQLYASNSINQYKKRKSVRHPTNFLVKITDISMCSSR